LLFHVVAAAYERRSLGIASHWPFDQWGRFLPEPTTAVSLLDRLLHHASVVVTDGDSYRTRQARARKGTTYGNKSGRIRGSPPVSVVIVTQLISHSTFARLPSCEETFDV
jgi:hypothetical protein